MSISGITSRSSSGLLNLLQQRRQEPQTAEAALNVDDTSGAFQRDASAIAGPIEPARTNQVRTDLTSLTLPSAPGSGSVSTAAASTKGDDVLSLLRAMQTPQGNAANSAGTPSTAPAGSGELGALLRAVQSS